MHSCRAGDEEVGRGDEARRVQVRVRLVHLDGGDGGDGPNDDDDDACLRHIHLLVVQSRTVLPTFVSIIYTKYSRHAFSLHWLSLANGKAIICQKILTRAPSWIVVVRESQFCADCFKPSSKSRK